MARSAGTSVSIWVNALATHVQSTPENVYASAAEIVESHGTPGHDHSQRLAGSRDLSTIAPRPLLIGCPEPQPIESALRHQARDARRQPVEEHPPIIEAHIVGQVQRPSAIAQVHTSVGHLPHRPDSGRLDQFISLVPKQRGELVQRPAGKVACHGRTGSVDRAARPDDLHHEPTEAADQGHHKVAEHLAYGPGVAEAARLELLLVKTIEEVCQQSAIGGRPRPDLHTLSLGATAVTVGARDPGRLAGTAAGPLLERRVASWER
jgi:hypothetical protein